MAASDFSERWKDQKEPWERLQWARAYWQIQTFGERSTPTAAARSLEMKAGTYCAYERAPGTSKNINLDYEHALMFAKKFKVSWKWLLEGIGSPFDEQGTSTKQAASELLSELNEDELKALIAFVEAMKKSKSCKVSDSENVIAIKTGTGG